MRVNCLLRFSAWGVRDGCICSAVAVRALQSVSIFLGCDHGKFKCNIIIVMRICNNLQATIDMVAHKGSRVSLPCHIKGS